MKIRNTNPLESGKILVTGGAGFIGSALVWRLNELGYTNIIITDVLKSDERWQNLVSLEYEDYYEADDFMAWLEKSPTFLKDIGIKTVFHFGACSLDDEKDASFLVENNFSYTKILSDNALNSGVNFIYASSTATYGNGANGFSDKEEDLHIFKQNTMYAYSKQMFELWAKNRNWTNSMTCLKLFNIFGANEYHKADNSSFVLKATKDIIETSKIKLYKSIGDYENGGELRDYLYIKDAVDMIIHLAVNRKKGIYNLGNAKAISFVEMVGYIFEALGKESNIEFIDMPSDKQKNYILKESDSIDKFMATGYLKQNMPMKDSIKDYVCNYIVPHLHLGE